MFSKEPEGACPGEYDLCFSQVWPKAAAVAIRAPHRDRKKVSKELNRITPNLDLYGFVDSGKMNKVPKFEMMAARKPFINYPSYKEQDSEDEERKQVEQFIKDYCRPPSVMAKSRLISLRKPKP